MYMHAQEASEKYASAEREYICLTPAHFLRTFKYHSYLLDQKRVDIKRDKDKYYKGLEKLKKTQDEIHAYHMELNKQQPTLQAMLEAAETAVTEIESNFKSTQARRDELQRSVHLAGEVKEKSLKTKNYCEETYHKIMPSLAQAINSVESIDKQDLAQLRSMNKPPKSIKIAMKILCIFLDVEPVEKLSKKTGKPKLSYWRAAQSKQVLGDVSLPSRLVRFDRTKLTLETMERIEEAMMDPEFSFQKAYAASRAASGIFKWIKFTRDFFYIFKEVEPRRDAMFSSAKQFSEKET
jgi:dynein heavy chain